jgi:hypothetical protein
MGDRANFGLRQTDGNTIFVYGHWAGENMLARFANALDACGARAPHDEAYANRIIISQLVGEDWKGTLGWGVSINYMPDNEHKVPVYDFATDTVTLHDYNWNPAVISDSIVSFTREEFINKYSKTLIGA